MDWKILVPHVVLVLSLAVYISVVMRFWRKKDRVTPLRKIIFRLVIFTLIGIALIYLEVPLLYKLCEKLKIELYNPFDKSLASGLLTFLGLALTACGFFLTRQQVQVMEDRIYGYGDLYDKIFSLIDETIERSKKNKSVIFQYYGQTLIPGHLAIKKDKNLDSNFLIKTYREKISQLGIDKEKIDFIALSESLLKKAYIEVDSSLITNYDAKVLIDLTELRRHIDDKTISVLDERHEGVIGDYYFSNGHTAIFGVSLHYSKHKAKQANESTQKLTDQGIALIGFRTTDRAIVKELQTKFIEIKNEICLANIKTRIAEDFDDDLSKFIKDTITDFSNDDLYQNVKEKLTEISNETASSSICHYVVFLEKRLQSFIDDYLCGKKVTDKIAEKIEELLNNEIENNRDLPELGIYCKEKKIKCTNVEITEGEEFEKITKNPNVPILLKQTPNALAEKTDNPLYKGLYEIFTRSVKNDIEEEIKIRIIVIMIKLEYEADLKNYISDNTNVTRQGIVEHVRAIYFKVIKNHCKLSNLYNINSVRKSIKTSLIDYIYEEIKNKNIEEKTERT